MLILKKRIESIILSIKKKENSNFLEDNEGEQNKKIIINTWNIGFSILDYS